MRTLIRAGVVITGADDPVLRNQMIVLESGRIHSVVPVDSVRINPAEPVIDMGDCTITPGLIDAHVHAAWGLDDQPGWAGARSDAESRFGWACGAVQRALAAGVTTMRDCGCPGMTMVRLRDAINACVVDGPRVLAAGPCITTTGGHGEFIGVCADSVQDLRLRVRELCRDGVDHIKLMVTGGAMDPETNRRRAQYSVSEVRAVVEDAHRLGRKVIAHCNGTEGLRVAAESGVDTISHCNWLGITEGTIEYDEAVAESILDQRIVLDLNIEATIADYAVRDGWAQRWPAGHTPRNRWELHADLRKRGAPIIVTSDEFGPRLASFPRMLADAMDTLDIDIAELIGYVTASPAAALGLGDELGTIKPGMRADLAAFGGDLTVHSEGLGRCRAVWRDGALRARNGHLVLATTGSESR